MMLRNSLNPESDSGVKNDGTMVAQSQTADKGIRTTDSELSPYVRTSFKKPIMPAAKNSVASSRRETIPEYFT